jgi:SAM-dependent methyltransferase
MTIEEAKIEASRSAMGSFLRGNGIEVGAGDRPFPVPDFVNVKYGDVRDAESLQVYFKSEVPIAVKSGGRIDAQTLAGIPDESLDFVISAHVLEHLFDPIGAVGNSIRVLRPGGIFILVIPDMRLTFDCTRPGTDLAHLIRDWKDGGESTRRQAYEEHVRYVHAYLREPIPEDEIQGNVLRIMEAQMDIHVHAWGLSGASQLLDFCESLFPMRKEAVHHIVNENQFFIRRL